MENLALKREQERKAWEAKCQELQYKNDKLMKQVTGKFPVQGSKTIIWDALISEETKLRHYMDYVLDKEMVIKSAKQSVTIVKERLNKIPQRLQITLLIS